MALKARPKETFFFVTVTPDLFYTTRHSGVILCFVIKYQPEMPGFPVTKMPNSLPKNAKFEVLFTVSKKFKCQMVNIVDKILMPNTK